MPSVRKTTNTPAGDGASVKPRGRKKADDASSDSSKSTRELLLAAARQVLIEEGQAAVTTRRVASAANVNQALVHYHFGTIENLLLEVLDLVAYDARRADRILFGPGDLRAKWRIYMDELLDREANDGTTKLWAETVVKVSSKAETRQRYVETIATMTHERLLEVVRAGLPEGTPEGEIEGLTALILAVRKSLALDSLIGWDRGRDDLLRLVDELISQRVGPSPDSRKGSAGAWPRRRTRR